MANAVKWATPASRTTGIAAQAIAAGANFLGSEIDNDVRELSSVGTVSSFACDGSIDQVQQHDEKEQYAADHLVHDGKEDCKGNQTSTDKRDVVLTYADLDEASCNWSKNAFLDAVAKLHELVRCVNHQLEKVGWDKEGFGWKEC